MHVTSKTYLNNPTPMPIKRNAFRWRYWFLFSLLTVAFLGILWRVIDLTLIDHDFLEKQGDARALRVVMIPAHRGMILDRNGDPLAISSPVVSIWISPKEFDMTQDKLSQLATLLNVNLKTLKEKCKSNTNKEFLYLKRQLPPPLAAKIKLLGIKGLYFQDEFRRYYPESEASAQLLGSTNIDDQGQEGLELAYNNWLEGIPGLQKVAKDRYGHIIDTFEIVRPPKPGNAITLSIDRRIQYIAYHALEEGVTKFHAEAGSAIVLDTQTNEILALTNYPSFNPNVRSNPSAEHRNRAITDVFEPASTLKTFSIANALNSGKFHTDSLIDTSPGWMMVEGKRVQDVHNKGLLDLTSVLKYSSNVGVTKVTLSLPPKSLWNLLHQLGFGQVTNLNLPGERTGSLENHFIWHPFTLATLSFGYGMNATVVQLAQAYSVIANQGVKRPLTLFPRTSSDERKIMDPSVANQLLTMLQTVTEKRGTAPLAAIPGYSVAGKTGTAKRTGANGYLKHNYNSIFVGIVPAEQPRLVVLVVLYNLSNPVYYAGYTAGPIFADITKQTLHLLNIPSYQTTVTT